jgi:Asp-tRNA(Asn)/Glu-tRNA(Gln) amidotransferase C subunit
MARGPDFFRKMTQAQIDALEEFARHPGKTVDEVAGHLQDQQVATSRSAVGRWLQDFRLWDRSNRAAERRAKYMELSDKLDPGGTAKAIHRILSERIAELAMDADDEDKVDKLTRSFDRMVNKLDQLEERERRIAEVLAQEDQAAKSGKSATDVVATIKQALGLSQGKDAA